MNKGATVLGVDYADHTSLVEALQGIDVVISTFGTEGLAHQPALARAAKEAGAKLFVPSEFGVDTDRKDVLPTAPAVVKNKKQFREELEQVCMRCEQRRPDPTRRRGTSIRVLTLSFFSRFFLPDRTAVDWVHYWLVRQPGLHAVLWFRLCLAQSPYRRVRK